MFILFASLGKMNNVRCLQRFSYVRRILDVWRCFDVIGRDGDLAQALRRSLRFRRWRWWFRVSVQIVVGGCRQLVLPLSHGLVQIVWSNTCAPLRGQFIRQITVVGLTHLNRQRWRWIILGGCAIGCPDAISISLSQTARFESIVGASQIVLRLAGPPITDSSFFLHFRSQRTFRCELYVKIGQMLVLKLARAKRNYISNICKIVIPLVEARIRVSRVD